MQNLSILLKKNFLSLTIYNNSVKKTITFKTGSISKALAREEAEQYKKTSNNFVWDCTMKLRQDIVNIEPISLERPLTIDDIVNGEAQIPEDVKTLFTILYTQGSNEVSQKKTELINLFATDAVYSTSGGKHIPGKHISINLSLKSMTGSMAVVNVLNRFGHCVSNEKARQIDTGMEKSIALTTKLRPSNIRKDLIACIGLARTMLILI